jgi:hypothetical protein
MPPAPKKTASRPIAPKTSKSTPGVPSKAVAQDRLPLLDPAEKQSDSPTGKLAVTPAESSPADRGKATPNVHRELKSGPNAMPDAVVSEEVARVVEPGATNWDHSICHRPQTHD